MSLKKLLPSCFIFTLMTCLLTNVWGSTISESTGDALLKKSDIIQIKTNKPDTNQFTIGEEISFTISVTQPMYLQCFYSSGNQLIKMYPHRIADKDKSVIKIQPETPVVLDEFFGNPLTISGPIGQDKMTCFASTEVMLYKLPSEIGNENSFTEVKNYSLRTLFTAFKQSIDADVVYQSLTIDIKANTYKRPDETN